MNVSALVHRLQWRLRAGAVLGAAAAGLAALAGVSVLATLMLRSPAWGVAAGLVAFGIVAAVGLRRAWRRWTPLAAAGLLETRVVGLDNLVVTAIELARSPRRASERMRAEVDRQAGARAAVVTPETVVPLRRPALVVAAMGGATAALIASVMGIAFVESPLSGGPTSAASALSGVQVFVTPPAYLGLPPVAYDSPDQVTVPEGSTLRIEMEATTRLAWMEHPTDGSRPMSRRGDGAFELEWPATGSGAVVLAAGDATGVAEHSRLLLVTVVPDGPPRVRIITPGRDLAFTEPSHVVDIEIQAEDAEGLRDLELRFVRMSGSGESFDFEEGRLPLQVEKLSAHAWRGRARWPLAAVKLADGDSLVYRAMARDTRPSSDWVSSDSFTIDVGRRLEFAGAGSAVPDEDRKYAISQQMVIVKTERLQAERGKWDAAEWAEQTRFLAIEQRMVRSEVVFLSGGEVQDEVAEAEHSHELQEGRLENSGRAEMLSAINDMSRAEARLNAGDTEGALVFERAALQALQRAFDRRRYFLRTMPERSRIDVSRRLSGDRSQAQSFAMASGTEASDRLEVERSLMTALATIATSGGTVPPALVARLGSVEVSEPAWRSAALALAAAGSAEERRRAAAEAMTLVATRARGKLQPSASAPAEEDAELRGWWADESTPRRPR